MTAAKGRIPSLTNGVSQEPGPLRDPTQGSMQKNCISSAVQGLAKRPPAQHIAVLESADRTGGTSKAHFFRQHGTTYIIQFSPGGVMRIYDLQGNLKTVTETAGAGYYTDANPRANLRILEINNKLYVVNRTVSTAKGSGTVSGTLQGSVQLFGDLPAGSAGDVQEIAGDPSTGFDNYYAKYDDTNSVWREGAKPGEDNELDATTLPHLLQGHATTDFEWVTESWADRQVGDLDTIPFPGWVGSPIEDLFFFQGRLGMLADPAQVGMTRSGRTENWWPRSRVVVADDDPLDLTLDADGLHAAIGFDRDILLFADDGQHSLLPTESGPLTPTTVSSLRVSDFRSSPQVRPVTSGSSLFFAYEDDGWVNFRELKGRNREIRQFASEPISDQVSQYVPEGIFHMTVSSITDTLCVLTDGDANSVYVFQYEDTGNERTQAAWSKWEFDDGAEVIGAEWVDDGLYLVVARTAQVSLEFISFGGASCITDLGYIVHLDRGVCLSGSYDAGTGKTTWTLPYSDGTNLQAVSSGGFDDSGVLLNIEVSGDTVTTSGDWSSHDVYIGQVYEARYRLSPQYVRRRDGTVESNGYLLLSSLAIQFDNAGAFTVEVTPREHQSTAEYSYYSWQVGISTIGSHVMEDGSFRVPINARALEVTIDLVNDTHLPCNWTGAEWFGEWFSYAGDAE